MATELSGMSAEDFDSEIKSEVQGHVNLYANESRHPIAPLTETVRKFLAEQKEDINEVARRPILKVPESDGTLPLRRYHISSSHNTYLLSRQLIGISSAAAYTHVLKHGARCVEIDVWPHPSQGSQNEPIVTHGYTFSKSVPFRDVCEAINDGIDPDGWPVMISLECHVPVAAQQQLVQIMKETWGAKLVEAAIEGIQDNAISPLDLKGRILLIVEYYPAKSASAEATQEEDDSSSSSSSSESDSEYSDSTEAQNLRLMKKEQAIKDKTKISPELAALGVYAHSIKPKRDWLHQAMDRELNILINISESALSKLLPASLEDLIVNSTEHMRRIFPRGTRIRSSNLHPLKYWGNGSQIAALNWQTFDTGVQLNEAMFLGSPGWVLKDPSLRREEGVTEVSSSKTIISCQLFGICGLRSPKVARTLKTCVKVDFYTPFEEQSWKSYTVHCEVEPSPFASQGLANPVWNEVFKFETNCRPDGLAFIRFSVEEVGLLRSANLGIFCARVSHLTSGWRFARLLVPSGVHTGSTILLNFSIASA